MFKIHNEKKKREDSCFDLAERLFHNCSPLKEKHFLLFAFFRGILKGSGVSGRATYTVFVRPLFYGQTEVKLGQVRSNSGWVTSEA